MLLIEFKCRCGRRFKVKADLARGKGGCPDCKAVVEVPHFGRTAEDPLPAEHEAAVDPTSSSTPRARQTNSFVSMDDGEEGEWIEQEYRRPRKRSVKHLPWHTQWGGIIGPNDPSDQKR